MNVLVVVKGLKKVDFSLAPFGWIRDPMMEFCGVDDADTCEQAVEVFFNALQPVPFENVIEKHIEAASKDLQNALELYLTTKSAVRYEDTISISIIPVPKSSRDSTPEEIAEGVVKLKEQA